MATDFLNYGVGTELSPNLNYNDFGAPPSNHASSTGCTNSIVTPSGDGFLHDIGGASAATPNGTSPSVAPQCNTFWQDLASPIGAKNWNQVRCQIRPDLDTQSVAQFNWVLQTGCTKASDGTYGDAIWAGLQSRSPALAGNPKGIQYAMWQAVGWAVGDVPGASPFSFGTPPTPPFGYQIISPFNWVAGRTYTMVVSADNSRGPRWFSLYMRDETDLSVTFIGALQASLNFSSYIFGNSYNLTQLGTQVTPANTCPNLPRSTTRYSKPVFSTSPATAGSAAQLVTPVYAPLSPDSRILTGRKIGFRYDLLDADLGLKKELTEVSSAEVEWNSSNTVSRTASFTMKDDPDINWFSDRIQPWLLIQKPFTVDVEEYPLGVFAFLSPPRTITMHGAYRTIQGFDLTQELDNSPFTQPGWMIDGGRSLEVGRTITDGVAEIILTSGVSYLIPEDGDLSNLIGPSDELLPAKRQFELGSSRLDAINLLLDQIGYYPLYTNGFGYYLSQEIPNFAEAEPDVEYATDDDSWVQYPLADSLDTSRIWNAVMLMAEAPNGTSKFRTILKNIAVTSPVSITALGRELWAPPETLQDISSQAQLDKVARVRLQQGTDLFQVVEFETPIESRPEAYSVVGLTADIPGQDDQISGTFVERQWKIECKPGGTMSHTLHRIIPVEDVDDFI